MGRRGRSRLPSWRWTLPELSELWLLDFLD
jgi:hypothetical protein